MSNLIDSSSLFFEYGIHIDSRTLSLDSRENLEGEPNGIDDKVSERFLKGLRILENISKDSITIICKSPGGSVYDGLAIYDAIQASPCEIIVVGYGNVMSMASVIFQAAHKRILSSNTRMMIHAGQLSVGGHPEDVKRWKREMDRTDEQIKQIYLTRIKNKQPKFTLKDLERLLRFDTILTASQAIKFGLADEILPTFNNGVNIMRGKKKVKKVMEEFMRGKLKSISGEEVTSHEQAIAIALSEAGLSNKKKKKNENKKRKK